MNRLRFKQFSYSLWSMLEKWGSIRNTWAQNIYHSESLPGEIITEHWSIERWTPNQEWKMKKSRDKGWWASLGETSTEALSSLSQSSGGGFLSQWILSGEGPWLPRSQLHPQGLLQCPVPNRSQCTSVLEQSCDVMNQRPCGRKACAFPGGIWV